MAGIPRVELGALGLDRGAHLLLDRALRAHTAIEVHGSDPHLDLHLGAWARSRGLERKGTLLIRREGAPAAPVYAGEAKRIVRFPPDTWGLAARGSALEPGGPHPRFALADGDVVWTDEAPRLYAQAVAAQWDPALLPWDPPPALPEDVEDAVVQVMGFLIENELAALVVPARFLGQIHPHFREILQILAVQLADEARHVEVFTRRALRVRSVPGRSGAGGRASLQTLLDEPDYAQAAFLLSVLGEGSFLVLLRFLALHAPDPLTAEIARLAAQDEARHVAFAMAHLRRHLSLDPDLRVRLENAVIRRHHALRDTSGLNAAVFDALVLLAAGSWAPEALARGWDAVLGLQAEMDQGRIARLRQLGFPPERAAELSALHTRNFM